MRTRPVYPVWQQPAHILSLHATMSTSALTPLSPCQAIDFKRVAAFADSWKDNPHLSAPNRAMAEDLAWLAAHIEQSASPDASDGSAVREMACHLCRLLSENKLPPCRTDGCALHAAL